MNLKFLLFSILFFSASQISFSQTRHALIVAIGNYPEPDINNWKVINSVNDVPLIKNTLVNSQHFSEKNIQLLIDSEATKKGILDALDKLYASVQKGDIVVIHFSSHGQQLEDDNADEIDGLDEAIVPYGAAFDENPARYKELAEGYIRDDLFGEKVTQLRNKLGRNGDLLVILDACHSGSGTRGVQTAEIRGGHVAMVSSNFNNKRFADTDKAAVFKENEQTKLSADAATYVLISGAQARENNYECFDEDKKRVGSLSYSFSRAMSSLKGNITYQGLFAMIENIMLEKAPRQKPVLEGDGVNRELFGGKYERQQTYFAINQKLSKVDSIVLNAGYVSGITKGSVIHFFDPGTTSTTGKKPLGIGTVISSSAFASIVKTDNVDANLVKKNPWAFINELSYAAQKLKLLVQADKATEKMVKDGLKDFQLVEFNDVCDLFLDTSGTKNNWALKYPNTGFVFQDGFNLTGNAGIAVLKDALKRYDRFRYLKGLSFTESNIAAEVQLVFLDAEGNIDNAKLQSRTHLGRLELQENDQVFLRIINTGNRQFYINIVDIQPDGFINPILPNKYAKLPNGNPSPITVEDCLVGRLDTVLLRRFSISIQKPYGEETFKIFLSSAPIDLEDILTSKNENEAVAKRGILSGLEKIFVDSNINEVGKRGGAVTLVNTDQNGTIFSLNFSIVPK